MTRKEALDILLAAKKDTGLSFVDLAKTLARDKVWVAAALMGQATLSAAEARQLAEVLGTSPEVTAPLQEPPLTRGFGHHGPGRPAHLSVSRNHPGLRHGNEGRDPRDVRRWHHERHRL